jgi:hypothetical protein
MYLYVLEVNYDYTELQLQFCWAQKLWSFFGGVTQRRDLEASTSPSIDPLRLRAAKK